MFCKQKGISHICKVRKFREAATISLLEAIYSGYCQFDLDSLRENNDGMD